MNSSVAYPLIFDESLYCTIFGAHDIVVAVVGALGTNLLDSAGLPLVTTSLLSSVVQVP